jgi:type II restriction enzyme
MRYALATWEVRDLLLIPSFMFSESAVIKRKPLAATARRAGWVGCNIDLHRIAPEARIAIVTGSQIAPAAEVRAQYKRVKPLKDISVTQRGWTLDVLNAVRRLVSEGRALRAPKFGKMGTRITRPSDSFTTTDAYAFTRELEKLHPDNRHVKDKIRQQLQVLRDLGLLSHIERGVWRLP